MKNGPSLGGYGAVAMNTALTTSMTTLPEQLRKTLFWDRGKELSGHAQFAFDAGTRVFFVDPHSPRQRPRNENTNGLLRQYFPKGIDLSRWSAQDLETVALAINNRPRKTLDWRTPAEAFSEQLRSLQQPGVASTRRSARTPTPRRCPPPTGGRSGAGAGKSCPGPHATFPGHLTRNTLRHPRNSPAPYGDGCGNSFCRLINRVRRACASPIVTVIRRPQPRRMRRRPPRFSFRDCRFSGPNSSTQTTRSSAVGLS